MFNAPRPGQRYDASSSFASGFGSASFMNDPLAASVYDGLDPWSSAPTPELPPPLTASTGVPPTPFAAVIADATAPPLYHKAFSVVDPTGVGEVSVNAMSRVLLTSGLSASAVDRIVNLVSSHPRVSRLEFFVALALLALAQSGKDLSIEQVASLASQNSLPVPSLDLSAIAPSTSSTITFPDAPQPSYLSDRPTDSILSSQNASQPSYSSDNPWQNSRFFDVGGSVGGSTGATAGPATGAGASLANGAASSISGTGLPREWWRRQERVQVKRLGPQGFLLNKYIVYEISTDRGAPVTRRYSEFVFLWDCLVRRYPFRLIPLLPPKRVGPDESFLEQRRKSLKRFLSIVVNHPVIKNDGLLGVFLTEPSFGQWRKHTSISLEEESANKKMDKIEEMTIPTDLEDKLRVVRNKLDAVIEQWQKICFLTEKIIKRHESQASDLSRLSMALSVLNEVNVPCWRGDACDLCTGVSTGVDHVAIHLSKHSDSVDHRAGLLSVTTLESLKCQRDLFVAMRDLFLRYDRLAGDNVERLRKHIETTKLKLEGVRTAKKGTNWAQEVDRLQGLVDRDQASVLAQLNRRIFIKFAMWHELRVVLHNRENALLTLAVREFAREEHAFAESIIESWNSLVLSVENMPYE